MHLQSYTLLHYIGAKKIQASQYYFRQVVTHNSPTYYFTPADRIIRRCIFCNTGRKKQRLRRTAAPYSFFLVLPDPASHRYTVGVSADISTASVSLTGSVFVPILYQSCGAIDEEFLNTSKRNYVQKENAAHSGVC